MRLVWARVFNSCTSLTPDKILSGVNVVSLRRNRKSSISTASKVQRKAKTHSDHAMPPRRLCRVN